LPENAVFCPQCGARVDSDSPDAARTTQDTPKRPPVFISYGHDEDGYPSHEAIVFKIKEELEKRGHSVWIDKEGITPGSDWRRKIYEGIENSQRFLAFVSLKSVTSAYCQTEIRIAVGWPKTILPIYPLRLEKNIDIPSNISNLQCLDIDKIESNPTSFDEVFETIIRWIDNEEHITYRKEMDTLYKKLMPESCEARVKELLTQPFVGRKWLKDRIIQWDEDKTPRVSSASSLVQDSARARLLRICGASFLQVRRQAKKPTDCTVNLTRLSQYNSLNGASQAITPLQRLSGV